MQAINHFVMKKKIISVFVFGVMFLSCFTLFAVPYIGKQIFTYTQPDGTRIKVKLYGDEFFAYQETLDGYVIVQDPKTKFWNYALLDATGNEFISSGIPVSENKVKFKTLKFSNKTFKQNLRLSRASVTAKVKARQKFFNTDSKGRTLSSSELTALINKSASPSFAPPSSPTTGDRLGLCILIEFPDEPGTITQAQVDAFCNDPNYSEFSNATSVYGYYKIQSNGKLSYNNIVTAYVMAANNKSYYDDDQPITFGGKAHELIEEALTTLKNQGFDFTRLSVDGSNVITSLNIYYAGTVTSSWSNGLWPHKWNIADFDCGGGITASVYQISDMKSELKIGTFCHENGHMTCGFPDLYSYNGNPAKFNYYGLMAAGSYGGGGKRPTNISAYLKAAAGWADIVDVDSTSHVRGSVQVDRNFFYRYKNPADPKEYYLMEVRNNTGYEGTSAPGRGLVLYHCLETGSNTYSTLTGSYATPYECLVMEANRSTSNWFLSPDPDLTAPFHSAGKDNATDATVPNVSFWSGSGHNTASSLNIHTISAIGDTMTFTIGAGAVAGGAEIGLTAVTLTPRCDFGTDAASQEFSIWNKGSGTLNYTVTDDVAWLSCSPATGDAINESDKVTITYTTNALSAGSHTATITVTNTDNSATQTINVNLTVNTQGTIVLSPTTLAPSCDAGNDASQQSFELSNSGGGTITYTITDDVAWLACTPTSGTVKAETDTIYVNYTTNTLSGGTHTAIITVSDPNATNDPQTIAVTLNVIGPSTGFSIDDVSVTEGDAGTVNAVFTVTLTGASGAATVDCTTADNNAVAGTDYVSTTETLTFAGNGTQTFTVVVNGDALDEDDETFYVNLTNPTGGPTITDAQGIGTITDNDPEPTVALTVDPATIAEASGVATFTATLSAVSGRDVTVDLAFSGTATGGGTDYTASGTQIVIAAGDLTGTITVTADQDTLDEDDETVIVDIDSVTNGTEDGIQQQTTAITDDDLPPSVSINDITAVEGDTVTTPADFTLTLSTASGRDITVQYDTAAVTAVSDVDYVASSGTATISAGSTTQTITVRVSGDTIDEDDETFDVDLSAPVNVTIADAKGVCTITDDDTATISIDDVTVTEVDTGGTTPAVFTVSLSCESSKIVTVDYKTSDGSATVAAGDYVAIPSTTLTYNPGDTSKSVTVTVNGDFEDENDEDFSVDLSNATNSPIGDAQGVCTITDDDTTYTLTVTKGTGGGSVVNGVTVTVTADAGRTGQAFSVWTEDVGYLADKNASPTTIVMPEADVAITATYKVDPATAEKLTNGSVLDVYASQFTGMDAEFTKRPKITGQYTDPVKNRESTGATRIITKISKTSPVNKINCVWGRTVPLYNKKNWKSANNAGTSTVAWLAGDATQNKAVECEIWGNIITVAKEKLSEFFRGALFVPPEITSVERWDGGSVAGGVHANSKIVLKGNYFGVKAPMVGLEYTDTKGAVKQQRLKVLKPLLYADSKGKANRSCMDLTSATGASQLTVQLPSIWTAGTYSLVINNNIGLDTFSITILASGGGTAPVANDDAETLYAGSSSYEIDVLANDVDADADIVTIVPSPASAKTGKVSVSKGKIKYTPPSGINVKSAAFTDTFTYTLTDGNGGTSAIATVTVTFNPLTITSLTRWDGNAIDAAGVNPGALLIVNGTDFGVRAPAISLKDATGQELKLKLLPGEYADYKGKAKKSYTDLSNGTSKAYVLMPKSWQWPVGTYTFEVNNQIGGDAQVNLLLSAPASNNAPTANNDTETITSGTGSYLLDVLANDTDTESGKVTIILGSKTSITQGAKLSVDKKTNKIKYTRAAGVLCSFTDTFTYSLQDSNGASSGSATVTVTGALAP